LKEIPIINSITIALAWAVSLTFLPVALATHPVTPAVGIVFVYFFLRSLIDVEIPNIRDIESDEAAGVSTMPIVFGIERTKQTMIILDIVTAFVVVYAMIDGIFTDPIGGALVAGILFSVGITTMIGRISERSWLTVAPDMEYIISGGLLIVVTGVL
ncbi:MAG: UbiA family prenyltransferase, partial [Halobacteriaceae archaeon]